LRPDESICTPVNIKPRPRRIFPMISIITIPNIYGLLYFQRFLAWA
jgi:hypothetical protein